MILAAAQLLVIAWLPGAVIYRLPLADRDRRAALAAEERLLWQVLISLAVSLSLTLTLGLLQWYTFTRLLSAVLMISGVLALLAGFRLRLRGTPPTLSAFIVVLIVVLGLWRFLPPAEYIMGGKDPGTYLNEGILLAQRGVLIYDDPVIAALPPPTRPLFFPIEEHAGHFGSRFMGFHLLDPQAGTVAGQFPHLFPASIAVGYGIDGLTGARRVVGVWAILGLVAVYLAGARLVGRTAAAVATVLLAVNVIEVWFGRYPNSEVALQALVFGGLLANARAHIDGIRFFGPLAAVLLVLLPFTHIQGVLAIVAVVAANLLVFARGGRLQRSFVVVLSLGLMAAAAYLAGPMRVYANYPRIFVTNLTPLHWLLLTAGAAAFAAILSIARHRSWSGNQISDAIPGVLAVSIWILAAYALFFREPVGKVALENAYALRMYAAFYVTLPGLLAALIGYVLVARRSFWRDPALLLTMTVFSMFLFYKPRIVPEHFWAARRFLPVILPATLLLASAAASWGLRQKGSRRLLSAAIGLTFVVLLGSSFLRAAQPVMNHVEYAGLIPELERLAGSIGPEDMLIVESRDAGSDTHVVALPLAYIYDRRVLVLSSARPDPALFRTFLDWAHIRYARVYFLGGGGTELVSGRWTARPVASRRFQVPEYESAWNAYPRGVRERKFDLALYELLPVAQDPGSRFELDLGAQDDLHVLRFHAKEEADGRTMRWSQRQSFLVIAPVPSSIQQVELVLSSGGRPAAAPPADVAVYLNEQLLGTLRVTDGFRSYLLTVPPEAAAAALQSDETPRLRLVTPVWNPHRVIGSADDRELGVMVDRVQVR